MPWLKFPLLNSCMDAHSTPSWTLEAVLLFLPLFILLFWETGWVWNKIKWSFVDDVTEQPPQLQHVSYVRIKKNTGVIKKGHNVYTWPLQVVAQSGSATYKLSDDKVCYTFISCWLWSNYTSNRGNVQGDNALTGLPVKWIKKLTSYTDIRNFSCLLNTTFASIIVNHLINALNKIIEETLPWFMWKTHK